MLRTLQPLRRIVALLLVIGAAAPLKSGAQESDGGIVVPGGSHFPANPLQPFTANDPTRSASMSLLYRPDVQAALALTPEQKASLVTLQGQMMAERRQKLMERMQEMMKVPLAERRKLMDKPMGENLSLFGLPSGPLDKRAEEILKPEQQQRLRELDLRWRGPLALGSPEVAETVALTPPQRDEVAAAIKEYRLAEEKVGDVYRAFMMPMLDPEAQSGKPKSRGDLRKRKFAQTPEQLEAKRAAAQQKAEQTRLASIEKVLALLTPAQKQQWSKMQGTPFTFQKTGLR